MASQDGHVIQESYQNNEQSVSSACWAVAFCKALSANHAFDVLGGLPGISKTQNPSPASPREQAATISTGKDHRILDENKQPSTLPHAQTAP